MEQLTEDIIKRVALRFFRHYYKFRLRYEDQPVVAKYDLEGAGGIIADGYYSFKKENGKSFIATFEATSKASKGEVVYKPQQKILFWDSLAVACLLTALLFSLNSLFHFLKLDERTFFLSVEILGFLMGMFYAVFYFIARRFRRYRYIYAIEQFKKYHADEQWIALAYDVFEDENNRYFQELKSQCVFNGFGMLSVDKNLDSRIVITPSRHDIFKGRRRMVDFFSKNIFGKQLEKTRYGFWWKLFKSKLPDAFHKDTSLLRHRKTYYHQMGVVFLSITLIAFIFWRELQNASFKTIDEKTFRSEVGKSKSNELTEQPEYLGDSSSMPKRKRKDEQFWMLDGKTSADTTPGNRLSKKGNEAFVLQNGEEFLAYDCTRFYTFEKRMYIVEEGRYFDSEKLLARLNQLKQQQIEGAALPLVCFRKDARDYILFLGMMYNSKGEAQSHLDKIKKSALMKNEPLKITPLDPVR